MYIPEHFAEPRIEALHDLIEKNPLSILLTNGSSGLDANHILFHLDRVGGQNGVLHAHLARNNPVWKDIATGDEVLIVFRAADAYISPNWYPTKHETGKQVPTWNYIVAHAHGRVTIHDNERYVRDIVERLTKTQEATQPHPWKTSDSPSEYIEELIKAIVGIEVEIIRLVGKSKLGQDEQLRDIVAAGHALKKQGHDVIGDAMLVIAAARPQQS